MPKPKVTRPKTGKREGKKGSKGKQQYRVRNWREYNQTLVNRGSLAFWITEEALCLLNKIRTFYQTNPDE